MRVRGHSNSCLSNLKSPDLYMYSRLDGADPGGERRQAGLGEVADRERRQGQHDDGQRLDRPSRRIHERPRRGGWVQMSYRYAGKICGLECVTLTLANNRLRDPAL